MGCRISKAKFLLLLCLRVHVLIDGSGAGFRGRTGRVAQGAKPGQRKAAQYTRGEEKYTAATEKTWDYCCVADGMRAPPRATEWRAENSCLVRMDITTRHAAAAAGDGGGGGGFAIDIDTISPRPVFLMRARKETV